VAGASAGGNLATVLAHRVRDDPFFEGRRVTGQLLQIPCVVHPDAYPEKFKAELQSCEKIRDPLLDKRIIPDLYAKYAAPPSDPECSPLLYPSHKGLPPTFLQVCGADPLRDEALLYEKVLREDGVKTKLHVYPGVGHGFYVLIPHSSAALKFDRDFRDGLGWLLNGGA